MLYGISGTKCFRASRRAMHGLQLSNLFRGFAHSRLVLLMGGLETSMHHTRPTLKCFCFSDRAISSGIVAMSYLCGAEMLRENYHSPERPSFSSTNILCVRFLSTPCQARARPLRPLKRFPLLPCLEMERRSSMYTLPLWLHQRLSLTADRSSSKTGISEILRILLSSKSGPSL